MPDKKINPYDIEALEKSLNDSATRVSTIWISFLVFSLYLLIAAATVEHRQLLFADPVRLPVLSIDLPIWGFFVLAPILFVLFHSYVLLQVLLLARTADSYNVTLNSIVRSPTANAVMRQRLANTLFAQIFSGSPRERNGALGFLLRAMAWSTLAVAPVLVLFAFQIGFLPYHSHFATWLHRLLIFIELLVGFALWPLVLQPNRDLNKSKLAREFRRLIKSAKLWAVFLLWPIVPKKRWGFDWPRLQQQRELRYLRHQIIPGTACLSFLFFSFVFAAFPGEPHINILTGHSPAATTCNYWLAHKFDHIDVPRVAAVDGKEISRIEKDIGDRGLRTYEGERTRKFRGRNLDCAIFESADLRYVDFAEASMLGASFAGASLQGADFGQSRLKAALLAGAKLHGAYLGRAELQGAIFTSASLQGAFLENVAGQGTIFDAAQLQGASLGSSKFQGASLNGTQLQGANLTGTELQGASLNNGQLQGAWLRDTKLDGASMQNAWLQGADLNGATMNWTLLSGVHVWRAQGAKCQNSRVTAQTSQPSIKPSFALFSFVLGTVNATRENILEFIDKAVSEIRDPAIREATRNRMVPALLDPKNDESKIEDNWRSCDSVANPKPTFNEDRASFLIKLICSDSESGAAIVRAIVVNSIPLPTFLGFFGNQQTKEDRDANATVVEALASEKNRGCTVMRSLDEKTKMLISEMTKSHASSPRILPTLNFEDLVESN